MGIDSNLECSWVTAIVCAPAAAATLISLYTFAMVYSSKKEDNDAAFRVPLLHDEKGNSRSSVGGGNDADFEAGGIGSKSHSQVGGPITLGAQHRSTPPPHPSLSPRDRTNLGLYDNHVPEAKE